MHLTRAGRLRQERDGEQRGEREKRFHAAYYNPRIGKALLVLALAATACGPKTAPARPALPGAVALPALQRSIDTILSDPALARASWGVLVRSLKTDETLYAVNARKLLLPASNMKIVTLAAAAETLGWDYTYTTTVRAAGAIDNGVLAGDLLVSGSGDPSLTATDDRADRVFADWASRLQRAGIRTITGRIVAADEEPVDGLGAGWMWDDLVEDYAAAVGPLQLNEDAVRVTIAPGPSVGASAGVSVAPFPGALAIDSTVTTSSAGTEPAIRLRRLPGSARLELRGSIPLGHAPAAYGVSIDDPAQFFVDALRGALIRNGIDVRQDRMANRESRITPLVEYRSPPLSTLAVRLMKISQNQYAETLFRTVGGREAVLNVVTPWGVAPADLIQRDGSGLSRYDLVTPDALVAVLTHVARDAKLKDPFVASLPIAGDLGLTNRMKGTAAEGNARAKTGSMTAVRSLSGYVTTADDEPLVFSIIANNFDAAPAAVNAATDAIVVRLAQFTRR
ncbi:MAG TPA: D-alanyl-D-alanine carboxypeptidase/D-alanyl-D-alanine-endopeptidase [Vicinamibacterales bacterium]|nr:D-alanyl-D-alanine carboxypeptidase/D-alanyl-D-alanine-endopeptidase [Vicinamibacterales bacterium]